MEYMLATKMRAREGVTITRMTKVRNRNIPNPVGVISERQSQLLNTYRYELVDLIEDGKRRTEMSLGGSGA